MSCQFNIVWLVMKLFEFSLRLSFLLFDLGHQILPGKLHVWSVDTVPQVQENVTKVVVSRDVRETVAEHLCHKLAELRGVFSA